MTGIVVLAVAALVAAGFGLHRLRTDGRFRGLDTPSPSGSGYSTDDTLASTAWSRLTAALPDEEPGERATLVQFSSAFCAPCRTTRVVLADVAAQQPGVRHVEVDAEAHLDLVRALDVRRTPTTLVLDAAGRELLRAAGAPRREQVLAALPS